LRSCETKQQQITILHTKDTHSQIEPFDSNHHSYANQGGVARRVKVVEKIRKQSPNTLLLDAGDIFQGTPYFNFFGRTLEFRLMSFSKYDAATLGNHDFDNSITGFDKQRPEATFDFVCANYNFKVRFYIKIAPHKIFHKQDIKIGVFGLGIGLLNLVSPDLYKETKYLDLIEITQDISNELAEKQACDLVIYLSICLSSWILL